LRFEQRRVVIDKPPILVAADDRRQYARIGAGAGAKIEQPERPMAAAHHGGGEARRQRRVARRTVERRPLAQPRQGEAAHATSRSKAAIQCRVAAGQSGKASPAAAAPAARRWRNAALSSSRRSAAVSAAPSPGGTSSDAVAGTVSGMAPAVLPTTGKPCASASAKAMP